ncbi:MAG: MFS transporter [candidate division Zixibacteria bacterium]|nr:MFS transporter [candidate division Zixibacteria bacterium]MBU1470566.1 MFS transporter [candidate division Zixibacteria bacterium]MBU2624460.1 MFS transporter [candidate division Zixibacteria bacterium]
MPRSIIDFVVDYYRHLRIISRNAALFLLGSFFINMLFSVFYLIFNLYLRELGFSESVIGRILSATAIGSMVAAIPAAILISKYTIKRMLLASTVVLAASFYLMVTLTSTVSIMAAAFLMGAFMSFSRVASAPLIMRNSTQKERTYVFSLNFANWMFAGIIGSFAGGYAQKWYSVTYGAGPGSYRFVLYCGIAICLLALIPYAMMKARPPAKEERKFVLDRRLLKEKGGLLFKLSFPFFLVGAGAGLIIPFLNLYFRDVFDMSTETIGTYYAIVQATMIIGVMAGPVLSKRFGMVRTLVVSELASIPFMLIMAFSGNTQLVVISFLCRGALMNMGQPIGTNFTMEMVSEDVHALANSFGMLAWTSSWAVSTQLGGWVIEGYGYTPSFIITICFYLASAALYYHYFANSELKEGHSYRIITPSGDGF